MREGLIRAVPWLQSFRIDDGSIDDDHRTLICILNQLCDVAATDIHTGHALLRDWDLAAMIDAHFQAEEAVMATSQFPDLFWHQRAHDAMRVTCAGLTTMPVDANFLERLSQARTVMVEHIIRYDLAFKSHLQYYSGR